MFIDFHTHKPIQQENPEVLEVISAHIQLKYPGNYYTIGYHPWWTNAPLNEIEQENLTENLKNKQCIGIGECGLDKLKGAKKAIQEEAFYQQIQIANTHNVPLIIHCVRQYDQILVFKKKYGQTPWAVHGFRRNRQLAKSLMDLDIKLSVSPLHNMNQSFIDMLNYIPVEHFFIETDSEYSLTIQQRYQIMADRKGIKLNNLKDKLAVNFMSFFGEKCPVIF
jgi:TatD DNase family protein